MGHRGSPGDPCGHRRRWMPLVLHPAEFAQRAKPRQTNLGLFGNSSRATMGLDAPATQLEALIDRKNTVEYEARRCRAEDAEVSTKQAQRVVEWARSLAEKGAGSA